MARLHLFEIEDQAWCPRWLRDAMTDYLAAAHRKLDPYAAAADILAPILERQGAHEILDLCSGAGGPWPRLLPRLRGRGFDLRVRLTDLHPNADAAERLRAEGLIYALEPVSGRAVPRAWSGFRTLFSSLHHFRPADAREMLAAARRDGVGIAAFEITQRSARALTAALALPLLVWVLTPFVRPRRLSRFVFTYLVPVLPIAIGWDGLVSCLRTYSVPELQALVADLGGEDYRWEARRIRLPGAVMAMSVLVGEPTRKGDS